MTRILRTICILFYLTPAFIVSSLPAQAPRIGAEKRLEAWSIHQDMARNSPFKELPWQALGPKFAGGRIEAVDAPRGDLATIYAGVGSGGVWKTTNGGLTWKPIFDNESTYSIGDITIAPSEPNTIWVGTGECHLTSTAYPGNGVFKSIDGGTTWENMGLTESAHIGKIVIDPENPDLVYVAAMGRLRQGGQRGVFKTTDGGKTFRRVLFENDRVAFVDLVIDPNNPQRIYASSWDRSRGHKSGVYRSDDRGENWKRLGGGLLEKNVDRVAIDVAASKAGVVYALMADRSSPNLARRRNASILFRSEDHGETWKRTSDDYVPTYIGWDFCDLRVAPDDENRVYVGGLRLIVSEDGGKTFQGEGGFAINKKKDEVFRLHPHRGVGMHLDVHDIWIDPENPERVFLGNDGGLYVSLDRAKSWLHLNSLPIAEFYRVHVDNQRPFRIWGGTQDNASFVGPATVRHADGEDDSWEQVFLDPWSGGDGFATFPDPNDSEITYYTQQNGLLQRSRLGRLRPIKRIQPRAKRGEKALRFAWDTPFFASTHEGPTVLYAAAQRVLRSNDRGDSWESISGDLTRQPLLALAESPVDPKRLVAGGAGGQVFLTKDGGENWERCSEELPRKTIRDIVASAHDPSRVFVVLSGKKDSDSSSYVFVSNDFGKSWTRLATNLPHESVNAIVEDAQNESLIFVGTDLGVYASLNLGQSWQSLCATLPTAPVVDLAVQSRDGALVAATHGLSLFLLDIQPIREKLEE